MKELFRAYHPLTEAELATIWKTGLITLDANVLLSLYRYSPSTREDLLKLLTSVKHRLWLPHQAGAEFYMGRPGVIAQGQLECAKALRALEAAFNNLYSESNHPSVTKDLRAELEKIHTAVDKQVRRTQKDLQELLTKTDPILAHVESIFEGRVGPAPTQTEVDSFYTEAAKRYEHSVPPGFEDRGKPDHRRYGDVVLWKQMIKKSGESKTPLLFVTDDTKKDWWWRPQGSVPVPLPALRVEMHRDSGQLFHAYETLQFMKEAEKRLDQKVKKNTLKELSDVADAAKRVAALERDIWRNVHQATPGATFGSSISDLALLSGSVSGTSLLGNVDIEALRRQLGPMVGRGHPVLPGLGDISLASTLREIDPATRQLILDPYLAPKLPEQTLVPQPKPPAAGGSTPKKEEPDK